jgi:hypothetical protein
MLEVKDNLIELLSLDPSQTYKYLNKETNHTRINNLLMMKKINKAVSEIINDEKLQSKAVEYITSDDEEEEEVEEEAEEEIEEDYSDDHDQEKLDTDKKIGSQRQKFSARSSSGFSREDEHNKKKSTRNKNDKTELQKQKPKEPESESKPKPEPKPEPKLEPKPELKPEPKLKEKEISEEISDQIEDNYDFN